MDGVLGTGDGDEEVSGLSEGRGAEDWGGDVRCAFFEELGGD